MAKTLAAIIPGRRDAYARLKAGITSWKEDVEDRLLRAINTRDKSRRDELFRYLVKRVDHHEEWICHLSIRTRVALREFDAIAENLHGPSE